MNAKSLLKPSLIGSSILLITGSIMFVFSLVFHGNSQIESEKNKLTLPTASVSTVSAKAEEIDAITQVISADVNANNTDQNSLVNIAQKDNVVSISVKNKKDYLRFHSAITKLNFLASPYVIEVHSICLGHKNCRDKGFYLFTGKLVKKQITWK